jgi:trehalose synthase
MADGTGGILVDSVDDCARAIVALLRDEPRARALGASGRERVRRHFLIPRLVLDELSLMRRMAAGATAGRALEWVSHRDPVCGMAVEEPDATATLDGLTLRFCSEQCRAIFSAAPERYLGRAQPQPLVTTGHAGAP